ncbi:MAG: tRNA uridine-5-carboxymethylaminomethyl(34) synthesis GTPase MnmE [Dissulfurispiraceae bacterium]
MFLDDTIVAISTPIGEGGIGIVRVSGNQAVSISERIFLSPKGLTLNNAKSHTIVHGFVTNAETGEKIDEVLVTVMRAPKSYTREDVVEINCHGGMLPLRDTLQSLLREGARIAEPGEFTRRAFLNGRIDLTQAEAVIDVIRAKTRQAEKVALQQLEGKLSTRIHGVSDSMAALCAHIEASIDFPEEEIQPVEKEEIIDSVRAISKELIGLARSYDEGKFFRDGVATAIVGKTNVGKSSLLNALIQRNRAIVTNLPGTTRDIVEDYLNVDGLPLRIMDTAGIRDPGDLAEREGVKRSLKAIEDADIVIAVLDASLPLDEADRELIEKVSHKKTLFVLNKCDIIDSAFKLLDSEKDFSLSNIPYSVPSPVMMVSALTGCGIDSLKHAIHALCISSDNLNRAGDILITNVRHKQSLDNALRALQDSEESFQRNDPPEITALFLREGLDFLGEIIGVVTSEDILNRIFSSFCIGK